jgi:hypothetical protein
MAIASIARLHPADLLHFTDEIGACAEIEERVFPVFICRNGCGAYSVVEFYRPVFQAFVADVTITITVVVMKI